MMSRVDRMSNGYSVAPKSRRIFDHRASFELLEARCLLSAQATFAHVPLYFTENRGQLDAQVDYYVQGSDKTLYFTPQGVTIALTGRASRADAIATRIDDPFTRDIWHSATLAPDVAVDPELESPQQRYVMKLDFVGANPAVTPIGRDQTPAVISYFKGPQDQWHAGLKTYASIAYENLWPGIDLVYSGDVNELKYTFVVEPGADPDQIKLAYRGATDVQLTEDAFLEISTPLGNFSDASPVSWQDLNGARADINTAYTLERGYAAGESVYGFRVGDYDPRLPLILDPAVLVYAGYIGCAGPDAGRGIAVDSTGDAYITGFTGNNEATFPEAVGPDLTYNGRMDAFVAKLSADGTTLFYAGYIGSSEYDEGRGIAVDLQGNAYVTGFTRASFATTIQFPAIVGPDLTPNGSSDAFVAKVSADGTSLVYAGFIGGSGSTEGRSIAVDSDGNAYVTGVTDSFEDSFPETVGPDLTRNGGDDAFIAKINSVGTGLAYCGYIGGVSPDEGNGIAIDSAGNAYITGSTWSGFPVIVGPDFVPNGFEDAFVAKVNAAGTALLYAGYIGGSGDDVGNGIAVDSDGNAYVTGYTESTEFTFPDSVGPDLTFNGGAQDAFVAKVNAAGTALLYAGYIGGSDDDRGNGITVDSDGNAYVIGATKSSEATFPVIAGPDLSFNDQGPIVAGDAFVAMINAVDAGIDFCGYVGGNFFDAGFGIALDSTRNAYITGWTQSGASTFPVQIGPDLTFNGTNDAFVARIAHEAEPDGRLRVINTNDSGPGTLRTAIIEANASAGADAIEFAILNPNPQIIQLTSPLPNLIDPATLLIRAGDEVQIGTAAGNFTLGDYADLVLDGGGTLTIAGTSVHGAAATIAVTAGTLKLGCSERFSSVSIAAGAKLAMLPDGGHLLVTEDLSIDPAAKLDLADNDLIVHATAATRQVVLASVTGLLATGAANLAWTGPGIHSSAAAGDASGLTALGVMLNDNGQGGAFYDTFSGEPVDANAVLVKYTYYGDADLSGVVDGTDYALTDNGFNAVLTGWFNGDFDYTNLTDGTDYALIDNAFNSHGGPLAGSEPAGLGPIPRAADMGEAIRSRSERSTVRQTGELAAALADWSDDFIASTAASEIADGLLRRARKR